MKVGNTTTDKDIRAMLLEALTPVAAKLGDQDIGWIPDDLEGLMVEACMVVIGTVRAVDQYHMSNRTNFSE